MRKNYFFVRIRVELSKKSQIVIVTIQSNNIIKDNLYLPVSSTEDRLK